MINITTKTPLITDPQDLITTNVAIKNIFSNFASISSVYGNGVGVDQLHGKRFEFTQDQAGVSKAGGYVHTYSLSLGHDFGVVPSGYLVLKIKPTVSGGVTLVSTSWEIVAESAKNTEFKVKCFSDSNSAITLNIAIFVMR